MVIVVVVLDLVVVVVVIVAGLTWNFVIPFVWIFVNVLHVVILMDWIPAQRSATFKYWEEEIRIAEPLCL